MIHHKKSGLATCHALRAGGPRKLNLIAPEKSNDFSYAIKKRASNYLNYLLLYIAKFSFQLLYISNITIDF